MAGDAHCTLYVTNLGHATVVEYEAGQSTPYQIITSGLDYSAAATVDKKGELFVYYYHGNKHCRVRARRQGTAYSPPLLP
jgi:hypothetical protein